ncbi:DUF3631 domain-containing protein [Streptomyces sp. NPDC056178]|uniref:DUF3631 domain-containing protein n=1 Tax=unclassified Streptomyces TaxID=2593676 RepID=UPI0035DBA320
MTTFPSLIDVVAAPLLDVEPQEENPLHRQLLDTFTEIQHLGEQLVELTNAPSSDLSAVELLDALTDLLVERLAAGHVLNRLLSTDCCCDAFYEDDSEDDDFLSCPDEHPQPPTLVHACLQVFTEAGEPDAMASADLVAALRDLPGRTDDQVRYADLTQTRLAQLLAPYEVRTRDVTLPDGRRRKSYRRGALLAALSD